MDVSSRLTKGVSNDWAGIRSALRKLNLHSLNFAAFPLAMIVVFLGAVPWTGGMVLGIDACGDRGGCATVVGRSALTNFAGQWLLAGTALAILVIFRDAPDRRANFHVCVLVTSVVLAAATAEIAHLAGGLPI